MAQALNRSIIMNFATPPGADDIHAVAVSVLDNVPDEIAAFCEDMELSVEEFPAREVMDELEVENEYELLAVYSDHPEKIPGVVDKAGKEVRGLILYRRAILDLWCDSGEDLVALIRNVIVSEVAHANGFSDEEIEVLCAAAAASSTI